MSTADEVPVRVPHPYICYQCNRVVSIIPPPHSDDLHCPICNDGDFLEEHHPDPVHLFPLLDDSVLSISSTSADHGNFALFAAPSNEGGASKEAVESLPCVKITEELIDRSDSDPGVQCTVCMSDFELGSEAKQIPCKHIFHSDCILPWLELHNSCPVCRYELPTDDPDYESRKWNSSSPSSDSGGESGDGAVGDGEGSERSPIMESFIASGGGSASGDHQQQRSEHGHGHGQDEEPRDQSSG